MMKAALYYGPKDIRIEEKEMPKSGPEGAVVRIKACGVCTIMDIDTWLRWPTKGVGIGLALGHEWSGYVVEVGSEVAGFNMGDRVYQEPIFRPCFRCESCRVRDYWRCVNWMEGVTGYAIDGSFAEYLWIPFITGESAIKLPETLDYRNLSLIEPLGLAVGLARKAKAGDSVLVLGQELIGLGVVAKLKERGIGTVIACDVSDKRLKASKNVGADIIVNSLEEDVTKVVMKETSGKGADVVIVLDPRPLALLQALSATRRAGMIWLATNYTSPFKFSSPLVSTEIYIGPIASYIEPPVTFNPCLVSCQTAWGTLRERQPRWLEAIKLIQSGKITAEKHVTHVFPLEKIEEAFNAALTNEAIKVLVEP